jgi:hypothetical protein
MLNEAGIPSMMAVNAGPCDSPAVSQRSRDTMTQYCQIRATLLRSHLER